MPYENPSDKPPVGGYKWVPSTRPTGGAVPIGYRPVTTVRGQFRNDLPVKDDYSDGTIRVSYSGDRESPVNSEHWPLLNAFRPLARPASVRGAAPSASFVVTGAKFNWTAELTAPTALSSITIEYSLLPDINDDEIFEVAGTDGNPLIPKDSDDGKAILAHRADKNQPLNIDWNKYKFAKLTLDGKEFPALVDNKPVELGATGYQSSAAETRRTVTIRFGTGVGAGASFPTVKKLVVENRYGMKSLRLSIRKVMLFNARSVNVSDEQLPCMILGYAFPTMFNFDPVRGTAIFPNNQSTPNFHFKLFSPDYTTASPGFAHSMSLRFLIIAIPITGIDPFSFFGGSSPFSFYFVVFVGPVPGTRNLRYSMFARTVGADSGRVVPVDYFKLRSNVQSLFVQKFESVNQPSDAADWRTIEGSVYNLSAVPVFDPIRGPWLREFTFYDASGGKNTWYKVVQTLQGGSQYTTPSFKGSVFSERYPLRMVDSPDAPASPETSTVVRRVLVEGESNPLEADPIALFVASDEDRPPADPISYVKGAFKLALRAKCDDPSFYSISHIFARIWFVPEDYDITPENIHAYRDKTEICFVSSGGTTSLSRKSPTDLSEVIVSPPLPQNLSYMELARYIDAAFSMSNGFGKRSKMVVGIYSTSYLTEDGKAAKITKSSIDVPKVYIDIDPQYMSLETTLRQSLTNTFFPVRTSNFSSSKYVDYDKPLMATTALVGGDKLPDIEKYYTVYPKTFKSQTNQNQPVSNAFSGLATLKQSGTAAKVALPYSKVPLKLDSGVYAAADFVTDGVSLMAGRVNAGKWKVRLKAHRSVDSKLVSTDIRFEALLVTSDGKVAERVFRSPVITDPGAEETDYTYEADVQIPFLIGNSDAQLVLRVYAYPYARAGTSVNITQIINDLKKEEGTIPFGLRIDELEMSEHTLSRLLIEQTDSIQGSPAFYEDLPLVPNRSIGDQGFWFIASQDMLSPQVIDANGWDVTGCLYSPSWFVRLPKGMEVRTTAQGFSANSNSNIPWFRTVLSTGKDEADEFAVTAVEDPKTGRVHVAHHEDSGVSGSSVSAMNDTGKVVRHYQLDNLYAPVSSNAIVSGPNANGINTFEGKNPTLVYITGSMGGANASVLGLVAQADENEAPSFNAAINPRNGLETSWNGPNADMGDTAFGAIRRLAQGMINPSVATDFAGTSVFAAGWAEPGTVVLKSTSLFLAGRTSEIAGGNLYVVDGDPNVALGSSQQSILPVGGVNGIANRTFPALMVDDSGVAVVAYTLEGEAGKLFARTFDGYNVGKAFLLANMRAQGTSGMDAISIYGPNLCWDTDMGSGHLAFWCGGKLFYTRVSSQQTSNGSFLYPLQLVAGDRDFVAKGNDAHPAFIALKASGNLTVDQGGNSEADVPVQRCGLIISRQWPHQGSPIVWYKDSQGLTKFRKIVPGVGVSAPTTVS